MEHQVSLSGEHGERPPPYTGMQPPFQSQTVVQNPMAQPNTWQGQATNPPPPFPQQMYHGGYYIPANSRGQTAPNQNFPGAPPPTGYANHPPFVTGPNLGPEDARRRQEMTIRNGIANTMITQPYSTNPYARRTCTYKLTRLSIGFFIAGLILLIMLGVLIVRPAMKDTKLKVTHCRVTFSEYTGDEISCKCGRYCSSSYPCLKIQVEFNPSGRGNRTGMLYQNVYDDKNQCSVQPCDSYEGSNEDTVSEAKGAFGQYGEEYTCFYDPEDLTVAYQSKSDKDDDKMTILHCILWPFVIMIASVALMLFLYCRAKGRCCFSNNPGRSSAGTVPYQTLQPRA